MPNSNGECLTAKVKWPQEVSNEDAEFCAARIHLVILTLIPGWAQRGIKEWGSDNGLDCAFWQSSGKARHQDR